LLAPDRGIQNSKFKIQNLIRDEHLGKKCPLLDSPYSSWFSACCQFSDSVELPVGRSVGSQETMDTAFDHTPSCQLPTLNPELLNQFHQNYRTLSIIILVALLDIVVLTSKR